MQIRRVIKPAVTIGLMQQPTQIDPARNENGSGRSADLPYDAVSGLPALWMHNAVTQRGFGIGSNILKVYSRIEDRICKRSR